MTVLKLRFMLFEFYKDFANERLYNAFFVNNCISNQAMLSIRDNYG